MQNTQYNSEKSSCTTSVGESTSRQPTWGHRIQKKHASTRVLDHRIEKCIKKNQIEMYQMQTQKRQSNSIHPPVADLPRERLDEHVFPFTHTGFDYFGPFEVKFLQRTLKRWCCLFTCLTTSAIHIEVAQTLDTESCLAAVTRFIARRGYENTNISDNGTNFVGAANELKAFMNEWEKAKIENDLAQKKIVWKFNPPGAPHFVGIWERLVQSCEKVIIATLDNRSFID